MMLVYLIVNHAVYKKCFAIAQLRCCGLITIFQDSMFAEGSETFMHDQQFWGNIFIFHLSPFISDDSLSYDVTYVIHIL